MIDFDVSNYLESPSKNIETTKDVFLPRVFIASTRRRIYSEQGRYIADSLYQEIKKRKKCWFCGLGRGKEGKMMQIHHIIPLSEGGKSDNTNCVAVHEECHKKIHKRV